MTATLLSARQVYDTVPLGAIIRFSDGATEPPARRRRKHAAWASTNATGRLVRKAPANHVSAASFTLHLGDFGSADDAYVRHWACNQGPPPSAAPTTECQTEG